MSTPTVWPSLRYHDALAGIEFLVTAFGFERTAVYVADDGTRSSTPNCGGRSAA